MSNPIIKLVNAETGEEIEREMTAAEVKQYEERIKQSQADEQTRLETEAARQSALEKLAALGLTEAEIQALAG